MKHDLFIRRLDGRNVPGGSFLGDVPRVGDLVSFSPPEPSFPPSPPSMGTVARVIWTLARGKETSAAVFVEEVES